MAKKKPDLYQRPDGLYEKGLTINGKRVRFRGKTEQEILQKIAAYKEKADNGKTFFEVANLWYQRKEQEVQPTTLKRAYKPLYERIVKHFGDMYIDLIKPKDIQKFISSILSLSHKSVSNHLSIIKQIFEFAIITGEIDTNPAAYIKTPRGLAKTTRDILTPEQIAIIEANVDYPVFGLFAYFLLFTGARRGEALALLFGDLDLDNHLISITKSAYYNANSPLIKQPKTRAGEREIVLLDKLVPYLEGEHNPEHYIFSMDGGISPLKQSQVEKGWRKYLKYTGLGEVTPHMLRHTYRSLLLEAGIDIKSAQDLLGHSDVSTTLNIYSHLTKLKKQQTADRLNIYFK